SGRASRRGYRRWRRSQTRWRQVATRRVPGVTAGELPGAYGRFMSRGDAGLGGYMDASGTCASVRSQLGVYLTGSILPADRAVVVRHLASCPACRSELADLAGLPGLLRRPACQAAAEVPGLDRPSSANPASDGTP